MDGTFCLGSGYRFASGHSFLKTYSFTGCSVTVTHDDCAVDCTALGRNILNSEPKP